MMQIIDKANDWNDLLNSCKFYTYFDSWEWGEIVNNNYGFKPIYLLLDDSFILPIFKARGGKKGLLTSNPLAEYGGIMPLTNKFDRNEMFKQLINTAHHFNTTLKVTMHPFNNNGQSMQEEDLGLQMNSDLSTYILDLSLSYEKIKKLFDRRARRSIRIAGENMLKIDKLKDDSISEMGQIYNMYLHTCKRKKSLPHSLKFMKDLSRSEMCDVYKVNTKENKLISIMVFLKYNGVHHSYLSATYDRFLPLAPVYFIYNEVIKNLSGKGNCYLDFGSVRKGTSVERFKKGWNADQYDILRFSNDKRSFDINGLSNIRRLWGRMPQSIIKYLGPNLIKYTL